MFLARMLAAYETAMRPMVEDGQGVPKIAPKMTHPQSRLGVRLLHAARAIASKPAVRGVAGTLFARSPRAPDLLRYG